MAIDKDVAMSFLVKFDADDTKLAKSISGIDGAADQSKKTFAEWAKSLDGNLKAVADSSKILHERIREVGKGIAFGIVADQFKNLKGAIDGTAASALSAGASGAAMGATFAGPWGAAIGGAIGLTKGLVTGLLDSESAAEAARKKIEEQGKAYWAQIEAAKRAHDIAESLAAVQVELAAAERQATEAATEHNRIMNEGADAFRHAGDKARAYQDALTGVDYALRQQLELAGRLADIGFLDSSSGESEEAAAAIRNSRGVRDATLDKYAATKSYGEALKELQGAENSRADRMRDLEGILGDVNVSEKVRNKALKEYNDLATEAARKDAERGKAARENAKALAAAIQDKKDPWESAKNIEAVAKARADFDAEVDEKYQQLQDQKYEPDLEADIRAQDAMDKAAKDAKARKKKNSAEGKADSFLERMGLADPSAMDIAATAVQGFADTYSAAMTQIALDSDSAGDAIKKGFGAMVAGVGQKLFAYGAAEFVEAGAHAILADFAGAAMHAGAGGLYTAGGLAAIAAAKQLGYGGSAPAASGSKPAASGGGAGPSRDANGVVDSRAGGGGGPRGRDTVVIMTESFIEGSPRMREQQARRYLGKVTGGQGWSND